MCSTSTPFLGRSRGRNIYIEEERRNQIYNKKMPNKFVSINIKITNEKICGQIKYYEMDIIASRSTKERLTNIFLLKHLYVTWSSVLLVRCSVLISKSYTSGSRRKFHIQIRLVKNLWLLHTREREF